MATADAASGPPAAAASKDSPADVAMDKSSVEKSTGGFEGAFAMTGKGRKVCLGGRLVFVVLAGVEERVEHLRGEYCGGFREVG